jgi:hypothetical protein
MSNLLTLMEVDEAKILYALMKDKNVLNLWKKYF